MVLTKSELIASLQKEVRLLLHLAGTIEPAALDYRPTSKQRSTIESSVARGVPGQPGARPECGVPDAAVPLPESVRPRGVEHDESLGGNRRAHASLDGLD